MTSRVNRLRKTFRRAKIEALLVTNFYNVQCLTGFVGLTPQEREAYVLVTTDQVFLFTDGRYFEAVKELSIKNKELKILEIKPGEKIAKLLNGFIVKLKIKRLGIEKNDLRISEYEELRKCPDRYARAYKIGYTEDLVEDLRAQKEPEELAKIERACQIADKCFKHLLSFLKPGLTEKGVADQIEWFIRREGAADLSFDPIVASGSNSSLPHYVTGSCKLKAGSLVLIDFGAKVDGYCSDMTRVVFLGKATEEQKKIYQTILVAQKKALSALLYYFRVIKSNANKKIKARDIDKIARNHLKNQGFEFVHGLGHGVALSEHEAPRLGPRSRDILKEGMVFSLEPGIYLPGKFGIRIEDLVVLEKSGPRVLTKSSKELTTID